MKLIFKILGMLVLSVNLSSCVTETTGAIKRAPDPIKQLQSHVDLGIGYISNGEYARAKDNLTKALAIDPNSAQAHNAFGTLFQLEGEDSLAEQHFQHAIDVDPNFSRARNNYGAFLYAKGRYQDAVDQLKVAGDDRLYQRRAQVFENLGISYLKLDQTADAETALIKSIQLNPSQRRALLELSELKYNAKEYVSARQLYARHKRVAGQSARSLWLCIRVSRIFNSEDQEASCSLSLRNVFPNTVEFKQYQASLSG